MPQSNAAEQSYKGIEKELVLDMKSTFKSLGTEMITSRLEQQKLLKESINECGIGSLSEAIVYKMQECNVGYRWLAAQTSVKRKMLLSMIEGRVALTPEVQTKIYEALQKKRPDLF